MTIDCKHCVCGLLHASKTKVKNNVYHKTRFINKIIFCSCIESRVTLYRENEKKKKKVC